MKTKFPRAAALEVARELCAGLKDCTTRLLVAGSLRRRKEEVGDVEILFIPIVAPRPDPTDLFGKEVQTDLATRWINDHEQAGVLARRLKSDGTTTWGAQNKLALHVASGIPVDFFAGTLRNFPCLTVCRTGSAETNQRICNEAIKRGLRWQPYGEGFADRMTGTTLKICRSEQDVFAAVGLPYLEPWER